MKFCWHNLLAKMDRLNTKQVHILYTLLTIIILTLIVSLISVRNEDSKILGHYDQMSSRSVQLQKRNNDLSTLKENLSDNQRLKHYAKRHGMRYRPHFVHNAR